MFNLGDTADPDSFTGQISRDADRIAAERAAMTPQQKAEAAAHTAMMLQRINLVNKTGTAPARLSPAEKQIQQWVLARDWDSLFSFVPSKLWGQHGNLGRFSFVEKDGKRIYIPFNEDEIRDFVFSSHYTIQPGHVCTDEQREMGVAALMKAGARHQQKFPETDWRSIWPIYPGWGYPGQRFGCEKYVPSTWVKIRKPVIIAAGVTAAVFLGPAVVAKVKAIGTGGGSASAAGATAAEGAGAAVSTAAGAAEAAEAATLFTKIKSGSAGLLGYVNQGRTIEAIANGELPPPPIGIAGDSFKEWATNIAKKELKDEAMEYVSEKAADEIVKKEEQKIRAEIEMMQRELMKLVPEDSPMRPNANLSPEVQAKMVQEKERAQELNTGLAIAVPLGLAYFLIG